MGKLELAMDILIEVFEKHAKRDGEKMHLTGREVASKDPQKVGEIIAGLDQNQDGLVDFEEFVSLVTKLTMCSNSYFKLVYGCGVRD